GRDVNLTSDGDQLAFGLIEKPSATPPILAIANADGTNLRKFPAMTEPGPHDLRVVEEPAFAFVPVVPWCVRGYDPTERTICDKVPTLRSREMITNEN